MKKIYSFFVVVLLLNCSFSALAQNKNLQSKTFPNIIAVAKKGNGVIELLKRYKLAHNSKNIEYFQRINSGNFDKNGGLLLNEHYIMPIFVIKFDGNTIRTTLDIKNYQLAKKIENYNIEVQNAKIKKGRYQSTKELWVPYELHIIDSNSIKEIKKTLVKLATKIDYSYLLSNSADSIISKDMRGLACYIITGHGGPDPGAIAYKDNFELHEHEYAYDVSLRLAKKLRENGADVYMIVQAEKDGIRESQILKNDGKERLINGDTIAFAQIDRLKQRTDIVNDYYQKNKKKYKHQMLIEVHLDSRLEDKQVDIFFYYRPNSKASELLSKTLLKTIEKKYSKSQPNRIYKGKVISRDLFTLRNTTCDATFIELGNIQNPKDQQRFLNPDNRQAIANWLYSGILLHYFKK